MFFNSIRVSSQNHLLNFNKKNGFEVNDTPKPANRQAPNRRASEKCDSVWPWEQELFPATKLGMTERGAFVDSLPVSLLEVCHWAFTSWEWRELGSISSWMCVVYQQFCDQTPKKVGPIPLHMEKHRLLLFLVFFIYDYIDCHEFPLRQGSL